MTLQCFLDKIQHQVNHENLEKIEVKVISIHWTHVHNMIMDCQVDDVGYDENHEILYIEFNKTGGD